jgi:hypothetical protein
MSHAIIRFATSADEAKIFLLLTALMEGELVGGYADRAVRRGA